MLSDVIAFFEDIEERDLYLHRATFYIFYNKFILWKEFNTMVVMYEKMFRKYFRSGLQHYQQHLY
jgi:hypothetical protein